MPEKEPLNAVRAVLAERAALLRAALARPEAETAAVKPDAAIGRLTRVDAMQMGHMTSALRREKATELQRVQRALDAIDAGTYGVCQRCEEPIAPQRLAARPESLVCVRCAETRR